MHQDAFCGALEHEITQFVGSVAVADLSRPVPGCPQWTVTDLAVHMGTIHRWANHLVAVRSPLRIPSREIDVQVPENPADFPEWLREGGDALISTLRATDLNFPMWTWGEDQHARFWARRMLHETLVHRVDMEQALEAEVRIQPKIAADGIEELLTNLPYAAYFSPSVVNLCGSGESLVLTATDLDVCWRIDLPPEGFRWSREPSSRASVTFRCAAGDLLLVLYRRRGVDVGVTEGDSSVLAHWLEHSALQ